MGIPGVATVRRNEMADTKVVKEKKVPKAKAEKAEKPAEGAKPKKVRPAKRPFSRLCQGHLHWLQARSTQPARKHSAPHHRGLQFQGQCLVLRRKEVRLRLQGQAVPGVRRQQGQNPRSAPSGAR